MDKQMIGMCGAYCGVCEWKEPTNCPGCQANHGKMFWGQCAISTCSIKKGYLHCGLCPELPCQMLQGAFNHPQHGDNGERLANLKSWAEGKDTFLKLTRRVSG
jgi:hypothetical protein